MAIPRDTIRKILAAGHPDHALVGVPVALLREIERHLAVEVIAPPAAAPQAMPA